MAFGLLYFHSMRIIQLLILLALFNVKIHALDLNAEGQKALQGLSKSLQKSKVIKVGPRLFNREVTPKMWPKPDEYWMGIVGDSSVTGAAASPDFQATLQGISDAATKSLNPKEKMLSPVRVMYTTEEFNAADKAGKSFELNLQSNFSQKFDTEEYSIGYQLGQLLKLSADKIVIAGQDGAKISDWSKQMKRLLAVGSPFLPPLVIVSFVANDLCPPENFNTGVENFRVNYSKDVEEQLNAIAGLPANAMGTRLVILQPLDVVNVLANPNLLAQNIPMDGQKNATCEQFRAGKFGNDFARFMQTSLRGECRGLLDLTNNPGRHLAQARALQQVQDEVLRSAIDEFNARKLRIQAEYAPSVKRIEFSAGDLANDCFHPSRAGAAKIAGQLLENELKNLK